MSRIKKSSPFLIRKSQAREKLRKLAETSKIDSASAHESADKTLLEIIGDKEISLLWGAIDKIYWRGE